MKIILQTVRLSLREFCPGDTSFIIQLLNSQGWLDFIGDRNIRTSEDAANYLLNGPIRSYQENGFGLYLVVKKDTVEPIGMCGLINRESLEGIDIGFALIPQFTGMGYAREIVIATMQYACEVLKLPSLLAITVPHNARSIDLLEKTGFRFEKKINSPDTGEELLLFNHTFSGH